MFNSNIYDIVIVGGGPAGMTAALYALRANKSVCVIEKSSFGGQITSSPKVENYPGMMGISGSDFGNQLAEQIISLDADVEMETVIDIHEEGNYKVINTEEGNEFRARTVIIANGVKHRMLGVTGEDELIGNGVYFCAVCDGAIFKNRPVAVIGGGNSALQEAILLSETSSEVTVIQNLPDLTGEMKLRETLLSRQNVQVIYNTVVDVFIQESGQFSGIRLVNSNGIKSELSCDGVFIAIGLIPKNEEFAGIVELNKHGYFKVGEDTLTKTPGVFVAGDCRAKDVRQLTTAVGDGAVAAISACRYIDAL
nr:FAD-dependent oxidoreductase [Sedimentibacter sp.]